MVKGIVIVTGIGTKEAQRIFPHTQEDAIITYQEKKYKLNQAAASAIKLAKEGYFVYAVGTCQDCLDKTSSQIEMPHRIRKLDISEEADRKSLSEEINFIKREMSSEVHIVFYESVSRVKKYIPTQNTFGNIWEISAESISRAVEKGAINFLTLIQSLRPVISGQKRTKVVLISSLSAITTAPRLGLHSIPKGAAHALARTMALDLTKENIFITEIMPGMTDTGYYDDEQSLKDRIERAKDFGYTWTESSVPLMSAARVAEAVVFAIKTEAHVRELSLIPYGQYPHLGA